MRACRLTIWSTILRYIVWLSNFSDYRQTSEYTIASIRSRQLIEDIVASVPYMFGLDVQPDLKPQDWPSFVLGEHAQITMKARAGASFLWPLITALTSDFVSPSERVYLKGKLRYMAETLGVDHARIGLNVGVADALTGD